MLGGKGKSKLPKTMYSVLQFNCKKYAKKKDAFYRYKYVCIYPTKSAGRILTKLIIAVISEK